MRRAHRFLLVLTAVLVGCHAGSATGTESAGVLIESKADSLAVTNTGSSSLYYTFVPESLLPLFDWYPCVAPACPGLAPGAREARAWTSYSYSASEHTYIVYTWRAQSDGKGGQTAADIRSWTVTR